MTCSELVPAFATPADSKRELIRACHVKRCINFASEPTAS